MGTDVMKGVCVMSKRERVSPPATTEAFQRLARKVQLLKEAGAPESAIDALIRRTILSDLAIVKAKRLLPSSN